MWGTAILNCSRLAKDPTPGSIHNTFPRKVRRLTLVRRLHTKSRKVSHRQPLDKIRWSHAFSNILTHHSNIEIHLTSHYHIVSLCVNFPTLQTTPQFKPRNLSYNNSSREQQRCVVILTRRDWMLAGWSSQGQTCQESLLGESPKPAAPETQFCNAKPPNLPQFSPKHLENYITCYNINRTC